VTPSDFIPEDDQSEFEVSVELPTGTSLLAADDVISEVETQLGQLPGVKDVLVTVGDTFGTGAATRAKEQ
jgi:HAE1 family hydrophobic/amphiphilic exporter-1